MFCCRICENGNACKTKCMIYGGYKRHATVWVFPLASSLVPCDRDNPLGTRCVSSVLSTTTHSRLDFLGPKQLPPYMLLAPEWASLGIHLALSPGGRGGSSHLQMLLTQPGDTGKGTGPGPGDHVPVLVPLAVWLKASHFSSLDLIVPICKMGL